MKRFFSWVIRFYLNLLSTSVFKKTAPGYRTTGVGDLVNAGNFGYIWSSVTSDSYGIRLGFNTTWLDPCDMYGRAYGFQLRCLSE